jgi:hypothetical protein
VSNPALLDVNVLVVLLDSDHIHAVPVSAVTGATAASLVVS